MVDQRIDNYSRGTFCVLCSQHWEIKGSDPSPPFLTHGKSGNKGEAHESCLPRLILPDELSIAREEVVRAHQRLAADPRLLIGLHLNNHDEITKAICPHCVYFLSDNGWIPRMQITEWTLDSDNQSVGRKRAVSGYSCPLCGLVLVDLPDPLDDDQVTWEEIGTLYTEIKELEDKEG
jgi:hypothetical protein